MVAGAVDQLAREVHQDLRQSSVHILAGQSPEGIIVVPVECVGQSLRARGRQPKHLCDIAYCTSGPVGVHLAHHRRVIAAVLRIDVLDHFLATFVREVEVDVRVFPAFGRTEPLEQEIVFQGIDRAEAHAVEHCRGRCRSPHADQDALRLAPVDDLLEDKQVAR